jgi:hypothetical protein
VAELDAVSRRKLRRNQFAFVDADGVGHLPIHDEGHVRNAISRWNQTDFPSKTARETARRRIVAAARRYDIEMSDEDAVAHASA